MKRRFLLGLMAIAACTMQAQNIQLHYDLGRNIYSDEEAGRQKVTVTLEQFKADKWGSWFYFVDLDFSRKETKAAYTEISREFKLGSGLPISAHVEYDGGLSSTAGSYQQAALIGPAWNGHNEDFSTTWSVQLMYKHFFKDAAGNGAFPSCQLTGVWSRSFGGGLCTFSGFMDLWRGVKPANGHGQLVMLTEPQLWLNATSHFAIGTEVEMSYNFIYNTKPTSDRAFFINPTLGVKWEF